MSLGAVVPVDKKGRIPVRDEEGPLLECVSTGATHPGDDFWVQSGDAQVEKALVSSQAVGLLQVLAVRPVL